MSLPLFLHPNSHPPIPTTPIFLLPSLLPLLPSLQTLQQDNPSHKILPHLPHPAQIQAPDPSPPPPISPPDIHLPPPPHPHAHLKSYSPLSALPHIPPYRPPSPFLAQCQSPAASRPTFAGVGFRPLPPSWLYHAARPSLAWLA